MTRLLTISKRATVASIMLVVLAAPFAPLTAQAALTDAQIQQSLDSNAATPGASANPSSSSGGPTAIPASNCALASGGSLTSGGDWAQCITDVVYVFTIGIGSGFAYVSAYFFDWAVSLSLNGGSYALDFVSQGWTLARDMANMAFLFILLYIAFKIIFEAETNETVHMLVVVIVIALLVNFSFFFTRLAIDAGNILSIQFYNAIDVPSVASTASGSGITSTITSGYAATTGFGNSKDLTAGIMGMLNLQGLLGNTSFQSWRGSNSYGFMTVLITLSFLYISAGIMLWLLTVAFIVNGVKFLMRIVVLWFLIIASPLAFVARAVPKFEKYFHDWLDALIKHAFYPAAFMFVFLILTNFAKQVGQNNNLINGIFNGLQNTGQTSSVAALGYAIANVGIRMGFVIAMLYIGMEAAKKIGVVGAEAANHAGNWVSGRMTGAYFKGTRAAGGVVAGTPAWLARNTVGAGADYLAKTNRFRNWASQGGLFARTSWRAANAVSRQSFDARGGLAALGVKDTYIGKPGGQGGYAAAYAERMKKRQEEAEKFKPSDLKYEQALQAEIDRDPSKKAKLSDLAEEVAKTKKDAEDNGSEKNKQAYAEARKNFNDEAKGIIEAAKRASGYDNDKKYASSISTPTWRNVWATGQGSLPGWIWRADKESGIKIRGAKTDAERIKNMLPKRDESSGGGPASSGGPSTAPGAGGGPGMAAFSRAAMEASRKTNEQAATGIVKAIQRKLDSTKLWSKPPTRFADNKTTTMMREQLKLTRSSINKALKSVTHEGRGGSPVIMQRGRSGRPSEREGIREHHSAPLPPTPPPTPPSTPPPADSGEHKE